MRRMFSVLGRSERVAFTARSVTDFKSPIRTWMLGLLLAAGLLLAPVNGRAASPDAALNLRSLAEVSVDGLRARRYASVLAFEESLGGLAASASAAHSFLVSFRSDGLRQYARVDVPSGHMPADGYPVVVFLHGWVGEQAAPAMDFTFAHSGYKRLIAGFADAGFVVVTPGYRGHGTVNGVVAEGIEFLKVWDNGTYVSPVFYAVDVLNLLEGLPSLSSLAIPGAQAAGIPALRIDPRHVGVIGHSQGGDVALVVMAVSGRGTPLALPATAGSIWSGTFPDRITQRAVYHAMETTTQAYLSGDGTWTGTAIGRDGRVNPDFVFGYPPEWGGDPRGVPPDPKAAGRSVRQAIGERTAEMYHTFGTRVGDLKGVRYRIGADASGRTQVEDDPRVVAALRRVGAYEAPELLTAPLNLHHSDRDFYAFSQWNADLCARVNAQHGRCTDVLHPGTTHLLEVSDNAWFSPPGTADGFGPALFSDIALFRGAPVAESRHD